MGRFVHGGSFKPTQVLVVNVLPSGDLEAALQIAMNQKELGVPWSKKLNGPGSMLKLMEPDIADNTKRVELKNKIDSLMSYKWDPSLLRTLALVEASHGATNILRPPQGHSASEDRDARCLAGSD